MRTTTHAHRLVRLAAALAAMGALLYAGGASAQYFEQGWNDPRVISPAGLGPEYSGLTGASVGLLSRKPRFGVEAGDFILQPRLFVEGEYRTNFFRVDDREGEPTGVFTMHIRPGVAIFNPIFDKVAMSFGADADVFVPISGEEAVTDQTNVGGRARLSVALFPKSAFTLVLHEEFRRSLWMRPTVRTNANRNYNQVGADLSFHPGGRALDFTLGYAYKLQRYDDLDELNTDEHQVRFLASWRFYPMTYAFLEATLGFYEYRETSTDEEQARPGNYVPGMPLKAYLGLSGYITERLALLVRAGYGNSFLDRAPEDFSSFIGQAQVSYRFTEKSVLHVGAARDMDLSPLGGYMDYIRFYGAFTQRIGDLAEIHADIGYDIRNFGEWQPAPFDDGDPIVSDSTRDESFLRAGVLVDFHLSRLFGATVGYRYEGILSDFTITSSGRTNFVAYDDHRIFASVNLRY